MGRLGMISECGFRNADCGGRVPHQARYAPTLQGGDSVLNQCIVPREDAKARSLDEDRFKPRSALHVMGSNPKSKIQNPKSKIKNSPVLLQSPTRFGIERIGAQPTW